ncbi:MAG: gamma carbonic anhydrase family protein [Bacillota bacterium]|jgi:carbonic anhydrase/acetyltransferase-like protein (isoleucine patch superfamily)
MSITDFKNLKPEIDNLTYVAPSADIIGDVRIGKKSSIWHQATIRGDINSVIIGDYVSVQEGTVIHVDDDYPVNVGNYVTIGHNATVHGCTIEDNCLIGMGSIILDGAVIGTGSIIGAGALIPPGKVIPPNSLVMGVPGKVVKELDGERVASNITHAAEYWNLALEYLGEE